MIVIQETSSIEIGDVLKRDPLRLHEVKCSGGVTLKEKTGSDDDGQERPKPPKTPDRGDKQH